MILSRSSLTITDPQSSRRSPAIDENYLHRRLRQAA
jgi:hypothetical protein